MKKTNLIIMAIIVTIAFLGFIGLMVWDKSSIQSQQVQPNESKMPNKNTTENKQSLPETKENQKTTTPQKDRAEIQKLNEFYSKDDKNVYIMAEPSGYTNDPEDDPEEKTILDGADVATFQIIDMPKGSESAYGGIYFAKDKNFVYSNGQKIDGVSGHKFEFIFDSNNNAKYAKDEKNVFILYSDDLGGNGSLANFEVIPSADPDSFQFFEHENCQSTAALYARDKNNAYFGHLPIKNSDGSTFQHVALSLAKDKNKVYFLGNIVNNADPNTIQYIPDNDNDCDTTYFKDKNYVYNCFNECEIVKDADPNNFKPN